MDDLGALAAKGMFVGIATVGQYVLPLLFGIGALGSFIRIFRQKKRFNDTRSQQSQAALFDMNWQQFEGLVSEFFRRRGYSIKQTGGNGPDGGIDLIAQKGSDNYFVQCKQWRANKVGVQTVRELYGVISAQGAAGGFVVSAGKFTDEAKKFANGLNITLINGRSLYVSMKSSEELQSFGQIEHCPRAAMARLKEGQHAGLGEQRLQVSEKCPMCGKQLVIRVAKKGSKVGTKFLGCKGFSLCRYTSRIK